MDKFNYDKPIYCVITGASRGLGRTIATELARKATNDLTLVLIARSEEGLNETKDLVLGVKKETNVVIVAIDLSTPDTEQFEKIINDSLAQMSSQNITSAYIFHNAGQIGLLKTAVNLRSVSLWQNYFTMNFFSVTSLNCIFVNQVKEFTKNITVVNITSLFGRKAYKYVGLYGSAKAARDLYFKILAEEEPYIKVLNWSPGMVKTDMALDLLQQLDSIEGTNEKDEKIKTILTAEQTVGKMFTVLEGNNFNSGAIVDFYDN